MGIEVHPDRSKRQEGLAPADLDAMDGRAKKVGQASVVLCDSLAKAKYDQQCGY